MLALSAFSVNPFRYSSRSVISCSPPLTAPSVDVLAALNISETSDMFFSEDEALLEAVLVIVSGDNMGF